MENEPFVTRTGPISATRYTDRDSLFWVRLFPTVCLTLALLTPLSATEARLLNANRVESISATTLTARVKHRLTLQTREPVSLLLVGIAMFSLAMLVRRRVQPK